MSDEKGKKLICCRQRRKRGVILFANRYVFSQYHEGNGKEINLTARDDGSPLVIETVNRDKPEGDEKRRTKGRSGECNGRGGTPVPYIGV